MSHVTNTTDVSQVGAVGGCTTGVYGGYGCGYDNAHQITAMEARLSAQMAQMKYDIVLDKCHEDKDELRRKLEKAESKLQTLEIIEACRANDKGKEKSR